MRNASWPSVLKISGSLLVVPRNADGGVELPLRDQSCAIAAPGGRLAAAARHKTKRVYVIAIHPSIFDDMVRPQEAGGNTARFFLSFSALRRRARRGVLMRG
jgi:hypothetical protein